MSDSIQMMAELAFSSINTGHFDNASHVFQSLSQLSPDDAIGSIGNATLLMAKGDIKGAINEIEANGLNKTVNLHEANQLLLIAAMLDGDNQKSEQVHQHFIINNICPEHEEEQSMHLDDAHQFFSAS